MTEYKGPDHNAEVCVWRLWRLWLSINDHEIWYTDCGNRLAGTRVNPEGYGVCPYCTRPIKVLHESEG